MPDWTRSKKDYIVKRTKMQDGAFLHLLVGRSPSVDDDLDVPIYRSLQALKHETNRAAIWCLGAAAFGILAHFQALDGAGTFGLEISPQVFSHAALLAYSLSGAIFCFLYAKMSFCRSWFAFKFNAGISQDRVIYLMKYPDAFFYFQYYPASVGAPVNIVSSTSLIPQVVAILLIFVAICIAAIGSVALWLIMAWDVLNSTGANHVVSYLTVALSAILVLLGWTCPFYGRGDKAYTHHGLVRILAKLNDDDRAIAHLRISAAAMQMGLVERPES